MEQILFGTRARARAFGALCNPRQALTTSETGVGFAVNVGPQRSYLTHEAVEEMRRTAQESVEMPAAVVFSELAASVEDSVYRPLQKMLLQLAELARLAALPPQVTSQHIGLFYGELAHYPDPPLPPGIASLPFSKKAFCSSVAMLLCPPDWGLRTTENLLVAAYLWQRMLEATKSEILALPLIKKNLQTGQFFTDPPSGLSELLSPMQVQLYQNRHQELLNMQALLFMDLGSFLTRAVTAVSGWPP